MSNSNGIAVDQALAALIADGASITINRMDGGIGNGEVNTVVTWADGYRIGAWGQPLEVTLGEAILWRPNMLPAA